LTRPFLQGLSEPHRDHLVRLELHLSDLENSDCSEAKVEVEVGTVAEEEVGAAVDDSAGDQENV